MTLVISVYFQNTSTGKLESTKNHWPAGFESYRTVLWGHPALREVDVKLLHHIRNDLYVPREKFDEFLWDCDMVEAFCHRVIAGEDVACDKKWWTEFAPRLLDYMRNFHEAHALAKKINANHIVVW